MSFRVRSPVRVLNPNGGFAVAEGVIAAFRFDGLVVVDTPQGQLWVESNLLRELPRQTEAQRQAAQTVEEMMAFEEGRLNRAQIVSLFKVLVDSGVAYTLGDVYAAKADELLASGELEDA